MASGKIRELWSRNYGRVNASIPNIQDYEYTFWKIAIVRNTLQAVLFLFAIYLPWYHLYRPPAVYREAIFIDAGAFELGSQTIGLLLIAAFISSLEVTLLIVQYKRHGLYVKPSKLLDIINLGLSLILFSLLGAPLFLPGLGGIYSDYISLFTLNFAGFQITPLIGYFCVLAAIISIVIGIFLYIFSP